MSPSRSTSTDCWRRSMPSCPGERVTTAKEAWRLYTLRELTTPAEALVRRLGQLRESLPEEAPPVFARVVGQMAERADRLLSQLRAVLTPGLPGAPEPDDPKFRHDLRADVA